MIYTGGRTSKQTQDNLNVMRTLIAKHYNFPLLSYG